MPKYRAWDKISEVYLPWEQIRSRSLLVLEEDQDSVYEVATGLYDKNNHEIYEGDIILGLDNTPDRWGDPQKWDEPIIVKFNENLIGMYPFYDTSFCNKDSIEIVGNVHQGVK